jgi:hypothetical protein
MSVNVVDIVAMIGLSVRSVGVDRPHGAQA